VADLVALGMVMAVGACGGPHVPLRGGRVDATGPGPLAFCNPESSIDQTLGVFSQAGMTKEEGITLVACGHTMGGLVSPRKHFRYLLMELTVRKCSLCRFPQHRYVDSILLL